MFCGWFVVLEVPVCRRESAGLNADRKKEHRAEIRNGKSDTVPPPTSAALSERDRLLSIPGGSLDPQTLSRNDIAVRTIMDLLVEQIRALDAYSKKHGISRAETIRRAVAMFLPNLKYVQPQKAVRMAPAVYRSFAARTSTFSMLGEVASSSGAFAMSAAAIFPER